MEIKYGTDLPNYALALYNLETMNPYRIDRYNFEDKIVVVLGAHVGIFTMMVADLGARVFAFEPHPVNYKALVDNVFHNKHQDRVMAFNAGVGESNGIVHLHYSDSSVAHSTILSFDLASCRVQVFTLKTILDMLPGPCYLLKADCEGAETYFFNELLHGESERVPEIVCEIHDNFPGVGARILEQKAELEKIYKSELLCGPERTWRFYN